MSDTDNQAPEPDDTQYPVTHPELPSFPDCRNTPASAVEVGVADYFNRHPEEAASILVAKAPDVLVLAWCIGAPKTARYFADRLNCKVSEKMIKGIKSKVARDIILVTREELEAAARSHPVTAARMAREPALCDPQNYRSAITPKPEQEGIHQKVARKAAANEVEKDSKRKDIVKKKPVGKPTEKPNPTGKENPKKTAEVPTVFSARSDPKHLTEEEMRQAAALLDADDAEDEDLYS